MAYRHVTPPSSLGLDAYDILACPGGSGSSRASYYPNDWSPATAETAATTPPKSPQPSPSVDPVTGRLLPPQHRFQDPFVDPYGTSTSHVTHNRTTSLPDRVYPAQFGGLLPPKADSVQRRPVSLYRDGYAVPTPYEYMSFPAEGAHRPSSSGTSSSASQGSTYHSHARHSSSSSIDPSMLTRYGYPTYRQAPTPQAIGSHASSALSHLAPISLSRSNIQAYVPATRRSVSPPAKPARPIIKVVTPEQDEDMSTTTVLDYLTSPNPLPELTQRPTDINKNLNTHFWFDVRNLRPWTDFTIDTITSIPGLLKLLKVDIPARHLPTPGMVNLHPETPSQLAELWAQHHAVKVNAALQLTQGPRHMAMRSLSTSLAGGSRQQPEFVANYHSDEEKTIFGDGRGRVVGVVKCASRWHSSMRTGSPGDKVDYLRPLAHLHRFMREHGTRYGFLVTERELVCVRAGGIPTADHVPLFGYLEVAAPVPIATTVAEQDRGSATTMTADLALWYLHMLAKEQPFYGQFHWKLNVGPPAALTRQRHRPRDDWMPKPNLSEKREARRVRGWFWPDEPLSKRECGRDKRTRG